LDGISEFLRNRFVDQGLIRENGFTQKKNPSGQSCTRRVLVQARAPYFTAYKK